MKKSKCKLKFASEEGSAVILVIVMLLSISLLAGGIMNIGKNQAKWSVFNKQTSNAYFLARSGAEKIVDSMNKEIAKEMPNLMEEASRKTQEGLLKKAGGLSYIESREKEEDIYNLKFIAKNHKDNYKSNLTLLIHKQLKEVFVNNKYPQYMIKNTSFTKGLPIEINVRTYDKVMLPQKIRKLVGDLVGEKDFVVQVDASVKQGFKDYLTKSTVIGIVSIEDLLVEEELVEDYIWSNEKGEAGIYSESLQMALISFGDFIVKDAGRVEIIGDIQVKGTSIDGGLIVVDGSSLKIGGSAYVVNNIRTNNSLTKEDKNTEIDIGLDAVASSISISDNYKENSSKNLVGKNKIKVERNVYVDNDLLIEKYTDGGEITVGGSAFGIGITDKNLLDPDKSSGIFSSGKNSQILVSRAFVGGQAFVDFDDSNGYHQLYESIGMPFEDVYSYEEYRKEYGSTNKYLEEEEEKIEKDKVIIRDVYNGKPYGYAPTSVSVGDVYDISNHLINEKIARDLFTAGFSKNPINIDVYTVNSDWDDLVPATGQTWKDVIINPTDYYRGNNPYHKNYDFKGESFPDKYRGLQGYMTAKRGVFYKCFNENLLKLEKSNFEDLVDLTVFKSENSWSYNNPFEILDKKGDIELNIDKYGKIPTAIISLNKDSTIKLTSSLGGKFEGLIITPGKVEINSEIEIEGIIIAGNEKIHPSRPSRKSIQEGQYAGMVINGEKVRIKYNKDKILEIKSMDKSLRRKLLDCLKITNYRYIDKENKELNIVNQITGEKGKQIVSFKDKYIIKADKGGLQVLMKVLSVED